jgi:RNA-directed DNA polymerase
MTYGFSKSSIDVLELPKTLSPDLPLIIDDGSLAFYLRTRPKVLWWMLLNKNGLYEIYRIPKRSGGIRIIHSPEIRLKRFLQKVERIMLKPIQERLGNHVTAYRPRRSIRDAVVQHLKPCEICDAAPPGKPPKNHDCPRQGVYIHMDLEDFFPSTRRSWIRNYFKGLGYNHFVSGILSDLMTVNDIPHHRNPGKCRVGVPQGAPTSGTICNIIADVRFDQNILKYLETLNQQLPENRRWVYTRYSDDLTLTCGTRIPRKEVNGIIKDVTAIVNAGGYRINNKKTRVIQKYFRRVMLGIVINRHPNIEKTRYMKLRALCHNCYTQGFDQQLTITQKKTVEELCYWLGGTINYVGQIHPERGEKLRKVFEAALVKHHVMEE